MTGQNRQGEPQGIKSTTNSHESKVKDVKFVSYKEEKPVNVHMPMLNFFLPSASFHEAHDHKGYEDENLGGRNTIYLYPRK